MPDIWIDVDTAITIPVNKVPLVASSDGFTIDETIAYNESGMDLNWNFVTTAGVQTQTNVSPTTAGDYDWTHVGNGMYKIEMTASGGASADNDTEGFGWFSGKADAICPFAGPTIGFRKASMNNVMIDNGTLQDNLENMYDGTGYVGGTIVLKADLTKIGGDAQSATDLKDFADVGYDPTNNVTQSDLIYIHGTALTETAGQLAAAFVKLFNVGTPLLVASDVMVGTDSAALASVLGAAVGASISVDIAAVKSETATIVTDTNEIQGKLPASKFMGSSDGADDDGTLNTINTNAARLTAVRAAVLTDWINDGRLDVILDAIKVVTDNLASSATTIVSGTVAATAGSTTTIYSDDITEATADHYNGRIIIFTSGDMQNQATDITDYVLEGGEGKFTVTATTETAAEDVTFVIV